MSTLEALGTEIMRYLSKRSLTVINIFFNSTLSHLDKYDIYMDKILKLKIVSGGRINNPNL